MPRTPSLRHRRDFDRVVGEGTRASAGPIQVFAAAGAGRTRLGLAVRTSSGAVTRNRVRRRLRAAFERCSRASVLDVVVRADDRAAALDFQELVDNLCNALAAAASRVAR